MKYKDTKIIKLLEKIKEKSEYDDRSLSQYINLVLKKHLEEEEKKK